MRDARNYYETLRYVTIALILLVGSGCGSPDYETPSIEPHIRALQPIRSQADKAARQDEGGTTLDGPLTLDTCVEIALDRNPLRRAAEEGVAVARAAIGTANSAYYPHIDLHAGYSRWERHVFLPDGVGQPGMTSTVGPTDDWLTTLNLRFTLFDSGQRRAELLAAMAQESAAEQQVQEVRLDIALNVHNAYYAYLAAREALEIAEKNLTRAANHLNIAKEKKAAGVIPDAEVIRVQVEVANDKLALVRAKGMVRTALGRLNAAMGLPVETPIEVQHQPMTASDLEEIDMSDAIEEAMHTRPELAAALDRMAAAQNRVTSAKSTFGPKVYAEARYGREDTTFFPKDKNWMTGLYLQIPLFDGHLRSKQVAQSEAQLRAQQAQVQHLLLKIQEEVWTAHTQLAEACETLAATEAVLQHARESMRLAAERYREGFATTNDLLDTEADLVRAEGAHTQARWNYRSAGSTFARARGTIVGQSTSLTYIKEQ